MVCEHNMLGKYILMFWLVFAALPIDPFHAYLDLFRFQNNKPELKLHWIFTSTKKIQRYTSFRPAVREIFQGFWCTFQVLVCNHESEQTINSFFLIQAHFTFSQPWLLSISLSLSLSFHFWLISLSLAFSFTLPHSFASSLFSL